MIASAADARRASGRTPTTSSEAYATSIAYSVDTLVSYVQQYGDDNLVMVFLGDHQPASVVVGQNASNDVPITIVAKDRTVLDRIASWGWTDGLIPAAGRAGVADERVPRPLPDRVRPGRRRALNRNWLPSSGCSRSIWGTRRSCARWSPGRPRSSSPTWTARGPASTRGSRGPACSVDLPSARNTLQRYADLQARDAGRLYGIWLDGVLVGGTMFVSFDAASGNCEVGCWLEPAATGRGLVTRRGPAADRLRPDHPRAAPGRVALPVRQRGQLERGPAPRHAARRHGYARRTRGRASATTPRSGR